MTYIPGDENSVDLDEREGRYDSGGNWIGEADWLVYPEGNIVIFQPQTEEARTIVEDDDVSLKWAGGLVVEGSCIDSFVCWLNGEGMVARWA